MLNEIRQANKLVKDTKISHPHMEEILAMFDASLQISTESLVSKKLQRPVPDKVLQEVNKGVSQILIPSTKAIALVLRYNFSDDLRLEQLQALVESS